MPVMRRSDVDGDGTRRRHGAALPHLEEPDASHLWTTATKVNYRRVWLHGFRHLLLRMWLRPPTRRPHARTLSRFPARLAVSHQPNQHAHYRLAPRRQRGERDRRELHVCEGDAIGLEREPREPADSGLVELRIPRARVERRQCERVLQREVAGLVRGDLGEYQALSLNCAAEAGQWRALCGHEQMFAPKGALRERVSSPSEGGLRPVALVQSRPASGAAGAAIVSVRSSTLAERATSR